MTYNLKKFRHEEVLNFLSDELDELKMLELPKISPQINRMQSRMTIYLNGLGRPRYVSNPLNKEFQQMRRKVQSEFSRLNQLVYAYCLRKEENDIAAAAIRVREMLVGFRGATKRAYRAQIELCKRATELLKDELQTQVKMLNLGALVDSLSDMIITQEILFEQKVLEVRPKSIPMKEIRAELSTLYAEVMEYVKAVDLVIPSEGVSTFLKHHQARWKGMCEIVLHRKGCQQTSLLKKRTVLRELALACGWKIPDGKTDFEYFGSSRILHPIERRWYGIKEDKNGQILIELSTKKTGKTIENETYQPTVMLMTSPLDNQEIKDEIFSKADKRTLYIVPHSKLNEFLSSNTIWREENGLEIEAQNTTSSGGGGGIPINKTS